MSLGQPRLSFRQAPQEGRYANHDVVKAVVSGLVDQAAHDGGWAAVRKVSMRKISRSCRITGVRSAAQATCLIRERVGVGRSV